MEHSLGNPDSRKPGNKPKGKGGKGGNPTRYERPSLTKHGNVRSLAVSGVAGILASLATTSSAS